MPVLTVKGVKIRFPFTPYQCQKLYMERVISCLNESFSNKFINKKCSRNCLLESPTGTGKTTTLLCSTLGWLEQYIKKRKNDSVPIPRIIYTTRTHTQITQIVSELKKTSYVPNVCVMASRKYLCAKFRSMSFTNSFISNKCRESRNSNECEFISDTGSLNCIRTSSICDVEDLVEDGRIRRYCPYYFQRNVQKERANIIIMPYIYLINPSIRSNVGLNLSNSIIIFDEGHNIPKQCEDVCSIKFNTKSFANCLVEMKELGEEILEKDEFVKKFHGQLWDLDLHIDESIGKLGSNKEKCFDGGFLYEIIFTYLKLNSKDDALRFDEDVRRQVSNRLRSKGKTVVGLDALRALVKNFFVLNLEEEDMNTYYRVVAKNEKEAIQKKDYISYFEERKEMFETRKNEYFTFMHFLCLSPSIAMGLIQREEPQTFILTSGTLSPLDSFSYELGLSFPHRLENRHVIKSNQMAALVACKGPSHVKLDSTFSNRKEEDYLQDLGGLITNVVRIAVGGVLVFFPSFIFLNECMNAWKRRFRNSNKSYFEQIGKYKLIVFESRDTKEARGSIQRYEECIASKNSKGAIFFAVCRGKVSEGLDFSDSKCRCVIMIGMPFPPKDDYQIRLKRKYLDDMQENSKNMQVSSKNYKLSKVWYAQQCARAVNQAIGRVIRHKDDFGTIILADYRYSKTTHRSNISRWIEPYLKISNRFGDVTKTLTRFFSENRYPILRPIKKVREIVNIKEKIHFPVLTEDGTPEERNDEEERDIEMKKEIKRNVSYNNNNQQINTFEGNNRRINSFREDNRPNNQRINSIGVNNQRINSYGVNNQRINSFGVNNNQRVNSFRSENIERKNIPVLTRALFDDEQQFNFGKESNNYNTGMPRQLTREPINFGAEKEEIFTRPEIEPYQNNNQMLFNNKDPMISNVNHLKKREDVSRKISREYLESEVSVNHDVDESERKKMKLNPKF